MVEKVRTWKFATGSIDISALLATAAGTSINVEFDNAIPVTWSGQAGLGLDNVSVTAEASVPEPGSIALLAVALLGAALASKRKQA